MVAVFNYFVTFITSFYDLIASIFKFVIHGFESLIYLIRQIPLYLQYVSSALNLLPAWLLPFCFASLYLAVFRWIINR